MKILLSTQFLRTKKNSFSTPNSIDCGLSLFHTNIRSLKLNLQSLQTHLLDELNFHFNVLGITETKIHNSLENLDFNPSISHYNFEYVPTPLSAGGVGLYIDERIDYIVIERCCNEAFQALLILLNYSFPKIQI